jgi:YbbR domain-containing protein
VPYGVAVAQVMPPTLSLELEKSATRTIPIVPAIDGDPAAGFVVGRISSEPSTVQVVGPESHVRQVAEATTEPVEIDGKRDRVRDVVTVGVADSSVRLVQPQNATVVVEITQAPVEQDIGGVPIQVRNVGRGLKAKVTQPVTRVTVSGRRDALSSLRPETIDAFVDLAGLGPGRYNLRVQVDPLEDFGVRTVTPSVVEVTIR